MLFDQGERGTRWFAMIQEQNSPRGLCNDT